MNITTNTLSCDAARRAILLADSGELTASDGDALDSHLQTCDSCTEYRRQLGQALKILGTGSSGRGVSATTMAALRAEVWSSSGRRHSFRVAARRALTSAACIVVAISGWWLMREPRGAAHAPQAMASLVNVAVGLADGGGVQPDNKTATPHNDFNDLACQLIILEDLADDPHGLEFMELGDEEMTPTDLQSHSSCEPPSKRCA
jgi:predicted anti-sigma-YlaC factor YlaD